MKALPEHCCCYHSSTCYFAKKSKYPTEYKSIPIAQIRASQKTPFINGEFQFVTLCHVKLKELYFFFIIFLHYFSIITSNGSFKQTNWFPMSLVIAVPAATSKAIGFGTSFGSSIATKPKFCAYQSTVDERVNA